MTNWIIYAILILGFCIYVVIVLLYFKKKKLQEEDDRFGMDYHDIEGLPKRIR